MAHSFSIPSNLTFLIITISNLLLFAEAKEKLCKTATQSLDAIYSIRNDSEAIRLGSTDYGDIVHQNPSAVLYHSSTDDIIDLIKSSIKNVRPFTIAARGSGYSVRGQAIASNGVVVNMKSLGEIGVVIKVLCRCWR